MSVAAAFHGMSADSPAGGLPAGSGVAALANIPDRQRRDGFPQPVIRREYSVIAMPVLPRRRDEIGEPVEELKRRELDDAAHPWSRGLSAAAGADPVGGFMPWKRVAHARDAAARVADHGEPLERKGRPGAIPQQVFQALKVARHIAVDERDPHTRIDGKPAVLPGEHGGSRRSVEQVSEPEPADHAAAYSLGEHGQVDLSDRADG